jgi:death-on-curing protein
MRYLTAQELLNIHSVIIDEIGGSHGVRDAGMLASLEGLPRQAVSGAELYPGIWMKAAVYIRGIIFNHPYADGNKRSAFATADVFLQLNGYRMSAPKGEIERYAVAIVEERHELSAIAGWLEENTEPA